MTKMARARYTLEFKQEAVRLVEGGHAARARPAALGLRAAARDAPIAGLHETARRPHQPGGQPCAAHAKDAGAHEHQDS